MTKSPSFFTSIIKHRGPTSYPIPDFFLKIFLNSNLLFRLMEFELRCRRTSLRHRFRGQKCCQLGIGQERLYKNKNDAGVRGYVPDIGNMQNLSGQMKLSLQMVNTCKYGLNTLRRYGPNIWKSLHDDLSNALTIRIFVSQIRNMTFDTCNRPCHDFRRHLHEQANS